MSDLTNEQPTEVTENHTQNVSHRIPSKFARRALGVKKRLEGTETKLRETTKERDKALEEAGRDALTGLPNRRAFDESVKQLIDTGENCGVLICDIDRFKTFNDIYGHQIGDQALIKLAKKIALVTTSEDIIASVRSSSEENNARQQDSVFRWGGEEFAVLLRDVKEIGALTIIAERIREAVEKDPHAINIQGRETPIQITISAGGAIFNGGDSDDFSRCLSKADENLYFAKQHGRNTSVIN